jgi:PKD repeat protein
MHALRTAIGTALLAVSCVLAFAVAPAGAVVTTFSGHGYGVSPVNGATSTVAAALVQRSAMHSLSGVRPFDEGPLGGSPLHWEGGPVMHSATTHVVFWDPKEEFTATTKTIVEGFFTNVAKDSGLGSNVWGVAGQYTDKTGNAAYSSTFGGALLDKTAYPKTGNCAVPKEGDSGPPYTTCLTDAQLQTELSSFVAAKKLAKGPTQLYFLLLPHKVVTCFTGEPVCSNNFFCAYHSYIEPGSPEEIIYADIPFSLLDEGFVKGCQDDGHAKLQLPNGDAGKAGENETTRFADVALKYISHEYNEAVTDPLVGTEAGFGEGLGTAWVDAQGLEDGDKCNGVSPDEKHDGIGYDKNAFLPTLGGKVSEGTLFDQSINSASYYLQSEWDNANSACLMRPSPITSAAFTNSQPVAHVKMTFKGSATDAYKGLTFKWTFGDGAEATGAEPTHEYTEAKAFKVKMVATDSLTGATAGAVEHTVEVVEPTDPMPLFTFSPSAPVIRQPVHFDGKGSFDLKDAITKYTWHFGDGTEATGASPEASHAYAEVGTYKALLTVEDAEGKTESVEHEVIVGADEAPTAAFTAAPNPATAGAAVAFNGSASSDPDGAIEAFTWDFGDGSPVGSGAAPSHTYAAPGVYTVKLTVRDSEGETATVSHTIAVEAPVITTTTTGTTVTITSPVEPPDSGFTAHSASADGGTGAISLAETVSNAGRFTWLATFANGRFGVFAAAARCRVGFVRLAGRCRPAKVLFARGSKSGGPGTVTLAIVPSRSARKALRNAARRHRGVPVRISVTFQSALGGPPVTHVQSIVVRLRRR